MFSTFVRQYKLTIVSVILILIVILIPGSDVPSVGIPNIDKAIHCGMFGVLTLCFYSEYYWNKKGLPKFLMTWLILELFAWSTEIMQRFVAGRSYDLKDLLADSIGILLASSISMILKKHYIDKK